MIITRKPIIKERIEKAFKKYKSKIEVVSVRPWFKTKLKIGLGRSEKYAGRFD